MNAFEWVVSGVFFLFVALTICCFAPEIAAVWRMVCTAKNKPTPPTREGEEGA